MCTVPVESNSKQGGIGLGQFEYTPSKKKQPLHGCHLTKLSQTWNFLPSISMIVRAILKYFFEVINRWIVRNGQIGLRDRYV